MRWQVKCHYHHHLVFLSCLLGVCDHLLSAHAGDGTHTYTHMYVKEKLTLYTISMWALTGRCLPLKRAIFPSSCHRSEKNKYYITKQTLDADARSLCSSSPRQPSSPATLSPPWSWPPSWYHHLHHHDDHHCIPFTINMTTYQDHITIPIHITSGRVRHVYYQILTLLIN